MGPLALIWAVAVVVARCGPPVGKPSRALVLGSRSTTTRRRARPAQMALRLALAIAAGRLAVAAPDRVEVMTALRAAVNDISRGAHLAGALALAGQDGDGRGGAGRGPGELDGGDPGGVLLGREWILATR